MSTQQPRQRAQRFSGQHDVDETLSKLGIRQETRRDLYQSHNAGARAIDFVMGARSASQVGPETAGRHVLTLLVVTGVAIAIITAPSVITGELSRLSPVSPQSQQSEGPELQTAGVLREHGNCVGQRRSSFGTVPFIFLS